jgi:hypothetical protein
MIPFTVRRPVFVQISDNKFALELRSDLISSEEGIRRISYQMEEYSGNTMYADTRTYLLDGRTIRVDELPDSLGNFTRTIFYAGSLPVEGARDLDGDGNPEIREEYLNGRLRKITLDQDGDGVNEFEQIFDSGTSRMYWDYNDDGLYDSRELTRSDGTLVRGFSSLLDGAYDLSETGGRR